MQWLNYPNQSNVDNLNSVECESSRHFRNKEKAKIDELETNSEIIKKTCIGTSVTLRRDSSLDLI